LAETAPFLTFDAGAVRAGPWRGEEPGAGWASVFKAFAAEAEDAPPLIGAYAREGETLVFTPRFAPSPGLTLRAWFQPESGAAISARLAPAAGAAAAPSTRIEAIYPSTNLWPANQLKFYIHFSAPMSVGHAWKHVRLMEEGRKIEGAFVEIEQELWDGAGRRLTVLFDPARIKRGLRDHEEQGLPLNEGRPVVLEIDRAWPDAAGAPLVSGARKFIDVIAEVRQPVDPRLWAIMAPAGANDPLIVDLPRPLDHAVALNAIHVERHGVRVAGKAELAREETRWSFTPSRPWQPGVHNLVVDKFVEDLAGNKLARLFDVDTADPAQQAPAPDAVLLEFIVGL
jgi:hypothetical protein